MRNKLNLSYAIAQGTYWMYFCVIISFSSVYLIAKGYSNTEIGWILALLNVISVIMQPIFADMADRSEKLTLVQITVIFSAILVALTVSLFTMKEKSLILTTSFVTIGALLMSLQPLINAIAFNYSSFEIPINYGVARSGGSIFYSALSVVMGSLIVTFGIITVPVIGTVVLLLFIGSLITTEAMYNNYNHTDVKEAGRARAARPDQPVSFISFAKKNKMLFIFSIGTLMVYFQNAVLNNYLFQIIVPIGGTEALMGRLFSFMAILELPALFFFSNLRKKFSYETMLKIASIGYIFKVFLTYLAKTAGFVYIAFLFQMISFPLYLASSVHLVDEVLERSDAIKGQSLITGMMTLSAVFASLLGGIVLDVQGPSSLLLFSTLLCVVGTIVVFVSVGKIKA
ncbi:MAG: MFS transporter [Gudongella sp.]|jgi:PPP family 3-phenylpropionic acid transporter|nr:MFS transporter [Gudongella sp.]